MTRNRRETGVTGVGLVKCKKRVVKKGSRSKPESSVDTTQSHDLRVPGPVRSCQGRMTPGEQEWRLSRGCVGNGPRPSTRGCPDVPQGPVRGLPDTTILGARVVSGSTKRTRRRKDVLTNVVRRELR